MLVDSQKVSRSSRTGGGRITALPALFILLFISGRSHALTPSSEVPGRHRALGAFILKAHYGYCKSSIS